MRRLVWICSLIVFVHALGACTSDLPRANVDQAVGAGSPEDTVNSEPAVQEPKFSRAPFDPSWVVEVNGFGPVRIDMSIREVMRALNDAVNIPAVPGGCDYVFPRGWPDGVSVMVVDGHVARVEVSEQGIETAAGAKVGMSEREIRELYPGQVEVQPHKYTDGHYLIVTPRGETSAGYRIIFETDGAVVENYRAGRLPEVEWVEGCS